MIRALIDVLKDLYVFVFCKKIINEPISITAEIPTPNNKVISALNGETAYITDETILLKRPVYAFDTKIDFCHYGQKVLALKTEGMFAYVDCSKASGWIRADKLTFDAKDITPQLESGVVYESDNSETNKIRRYTDDEFLGERLSLPLQAVEYIYYKLISSGINFDWPADRPRLPGHWHGILKGNPKVYLTISPKTSSVMEGNSNDSHFLAYVEAVHPDQSLVISSIGRKLEGEYLYEKVDITQWREWKPVFITFK